MSHFFDYLSIPDNPRDVFRLTEFIGRGTFGLVYTAIHVETNEEYAIKIINANEKKNLRREVSIMKELTQCENVVQYHGSYPNKEDKTIWVILEYCQVGSLNNIEKVIQRNLNESEIASIISMALKGMCDLHDKHIIHGDIKGRNILLNENGMAKICDFGVSIKLNSKPERKKGKIGSPYWMSPEILMNYEYDQSTDIWSLGITCIELAEGDPPNSEIDPKKVMLIIPNNPPNGLRNPYLFSEEFNDFISKCLTVDPKQRPSARELLNHSFILNNQNNDSIDELITYYKEMILDYNKSNYSCITPIDGVNGNFNNLSDGKETAKYISLNRTTKKDRNNSEYSNKITIDKEKFKYSTNKTLNQETSFINQNEINLFNINRHFILNPDVLTVRSKNSNTICLNDNSNKNTIRADESELKYELINPLDLIQKKKICNSIEDMAIKLLGSHIGEINLRMKKEIKAIQKKYKKEIGKTKRDLRIYLKSFTSTSSNNFRPCYFTGIDYSGSLL